MARLIKTVSAPGPEYTFDPVVPYVEPLWRQKLRDTVSVGTIVETCNLHVAEVKSIDYETGDIVCASLLDPSYTGMRCDLYHCGIIALTEREIEAKKRLYARGGSTALCDEWNRRVEQDSFRPLIDGDL
jgi:hypothetical protein